MPSNRWKACRLGSNGDYALRHGIWLLIEKAYKDANEAMIWYGPARPRVESEVQAPDFNQLANIARFGTPELTLDTEA